MTTPIEALGTAVRTRLLDWAVVNFDTTRVDLPGDPIASLPAADPLNPTGTSWVRLTDYVDLAQRLAISPTGKRQYFGTIYAEVFAPAGTGDSYVRSVAGSIAEYFRNQTDQAGAIWYEEPEPRFAPLPEEEADLIRYEVRIPVHYQFNPDDVPLEVSYPVETYAPGSAHGLSAGNAVYRVDSSTWAKAQANSEATVAMGVVVSVPTSTLAHISVGPTASVQAHGLGAGGTKLYLSQVTAGLLTATAPTSGISQLVATVLDANRLKLHDLKVEEASL